MAGELSGTSSTEWILDGRFQRTSSKDDGTETREIRRYDATNNKYHKWTFNSYGSDSFWIGGWDEETSTMTWQYVDFGLGITGEIVDHFSSPGKYKTRLVIKEPKGIRLIEILNAERSPDRAAGQRPSRFACEDLPAGKSRSALQLKKR